MADDVTFQDASPATPPSGTVVAADDVGGVLYQKVKLDLGGDGASTPVSSTVPVSDGGGSLTVDGSVTVADGGGTISVDDGGSSLTIDGTVAISSIAAGDNNIGNVDVASLPALAAGTNNIGDVDVLTLPALPAGSNNIGDVDVLTLPSLPAGNNNIGDVDVASLPAGSVAGATAKTADLDSGAGTDTVPIFGIALPASGGAAVGGTATAPVRTDPTGTTTQPVSDGGGSLTVDGTVAVSSIAAGDNNIGNVDIATLPALPAGTNNIGDVDVLTVPADPFGANADAAVAAGASGSIQAKLRRATQGLEDLKSLIVLAAGTNAIGKLAANSGVDIGDVDVTSQPARARTTDTISAALATDALMQGTTARTPVSIVISAATSGDNTLLAAQGASNKIRVLQLVLIAAGTVNVRVESGAGGTAMSGVMSLIANTGFVLPFSPVGWGDTDANTLLNLELSAAIQVSGILTYIVVT